MFCLSVMRKDLQASTLVGPTRDNPILDPLAVLHLESWLFIWILTFLLCEFFIIFNYFLASFLKYSRSMFFLLIQCCLLYPSLYIPQFPSAKVVRWLTLKSWRTNCEIVWLHKEMLLFSRCMWNLLLKK